MSPARDLDWLAPLLARYRRVLDARGEAGAGADGATRAAALVDGFNALRVAATAAARLDLLERAGARDGAVPSPGPDSVPSPDFGPVDQLVVLGPTQAGKSTLVDALLDASVAGISALAGHTVHAQAFAAGVPDARAPLDALDALMAPLARTDRAALERDALGAWSWDVVAPGPDARVRRGATVVWDTPDFDSIAAGTYREAVLAAAGLADRIVLALSADKYGDRSVWDVLGLVRGLGVPILVVVNKLDPGDEATVVAAFGRHHAERFDGAPPPPIVPLPWSEAVRAGEDADGDAPGTRRSRVRLELPAAFAGAGADVAGADALRARRAALARLVAAHRDAWLAPLREEARARERWLGIVAEAEGHALDAYERRWLDDERHDAFERTLAELLTLLEIPGLARTLGRARQAVTWPARTLLGLGRGALGRESAATVDREAEVLLGVFDEAATSLRERVLERLDAERDAPWWRALERELAARRHELRARWIDEAARARADFAPHIEAAARELHERLREQPALLNTLRATRVTTDAAGVALAFKSGGLAPADLVLAPAMLSLTSLLTESALGRWVDGVKRRLKREQREFVRERLVEGVIGDGYRRAADARDATRLLAGEPEPALRRVL